MDIFFSILKWSGLLLIVLILLIVKQEILFKNSKKLGWKSIIFFYVFGVLLYVLNDIFGFMH